MASTVNTTFDSMTSHNMTIEYLNREQVLIRIPSTIVVIITMILGFIGNSLTCYVYSVRLKMTPTYLFVVMLAIADLIACIIIAPDVVVIYVYPMMTTWDVVCKIDMCLSIFTASCNSLFLCSIAVERYRRVCCPLKRQITMKSAEYLTLCIFLFSAVLGSLVILYYGSVRKSTIYQGIYSHTCSDKDSKNYFQIGFYAFYLLGAISVIIFMVSLYTIILRRLKKVVTKITVRKAPPPVSRNNSCQKVPSGVAFLNRTESNIGTGIGAAAAECSGTNDEIQCVERSATDNTSYTPSALETSSLRVYSDENTSQCTPATKWIPQISTQQSKRGRNSNRRARKDLERLRRTTVTMMLITAVYIITYIPCTCAVIVSAVVKSEDNMSPVTAMFYWLARNSFCINSCVNPIIYGYRNQRFVNEAKKIFRIKY